MANTILHKKNSSTGVAPTTGQLSLGELAINTFDGTLYLKKNDGGDSIIVVGELVNDLTPQLGADLDVNNFTIGDADDDSKISFGTGDSDLIQIFAGSNGANQFLTTNPVFEVRTEDNKGNYENTMLIAALDADVTANFHGGGDLTVRGGAGTASDTAGSLTLEAGTPGSGGSPSNIVLSGTTASGSTALILTGGSGTANGCAIDINGGVAGGTTNSGGAVDIDAGNGGSSSGVGGDILIDAGRAVGGTSNGGKVLIQSGLNATGGTAGKLEIFGVNGTTDDGGLLNLTAGGPADATSNGGKVQIDAGGGGSSGGTGGDIDIHGGNANNGNGGQLNIRGGTSASGTPGHVTVQCDLEIDEALYFDAVVANAAATTVDWNDGNIQTSVPTGIITYTFTAPGGPAVLYFVATDLSTQTPTWPATVKWPAGTEPTWTTGKDVITFVYDGTDYLATAVELNVS